MANWCFNTVTFQGNDVQIDSIQNLISNMRKQYMTTNQGQLPSFIDKQTEFFFDMEMTDNVLYYVTKWSPNLETMKDVADHFEVGFTFRYEETANGIYGEAVYKDGQLRYIALEIDDFAKYSFDEANECYLFEGDSYENDSDILELLLDRRKGRTAGSQSI